MAAFGQNARAEGLPPLIEAMVTLCPASTCRDAGTDVNTQPCSNGSSESEAGAKQCGSGMTVGRCVARHHTELHGSGAHEHPVWCRKLLQPQASDVVADLAGAVCALTTTSRKVSCSADARHLLVRAAMGTQNTRAPGADNEDVLGHGVFAFHRCSVSWCGMCEGSKTGCCMGCSAWCEGRVCLLTMPFGVTNMTSSGI